MAANAWKLYDTFKLYLGNTGIDMDTNAFKMALFQSTSNCATLTNDVYGDLTNEVANANGYTTGGVSLTTLSWANSSGTITWDCDNAVWTASGGSITARFAVIYCNDTVGGIVKPLVGFSLLDNTPADVTATAGNTLTIALNASGVFTLSGGTA